MPAALNADARPMTPAPHRTPPQRAARFVEGSLLRHVVVMSGTGAIGLLAMFAVDLLNMIYISHLGDTALTAGMGFAASFGFFQMAIFIGMSVGLVATVGRAIGGGRRQDARRIAASGMALMMLAAVAAAAVTLAFRHDGLAALGASGAPARHAARYLAITALGLPFLAASMAGSGLLRCTGDARRSMTVTIAGALLTAALDPLLIYGAHLGLDGAAIAAIGSRLTVAVLSWHAVVRRHDLLGRLEPAHWAADLRAIARIAGPAIATNLATPVGGAFTTHMIARFGVAAVTGQVTIDRLSIFAFGFVYALTGAVGPIIAQNLGAGRFDRVSETLRCSFGVTVAWVLGAWAVLALGLHPILLAFSASGETARLIALFCHLLAGSFLFTGSLFVANTAFNNLGFPMLATAFNWGRATLGTIPFVLAGAGYGAAGVMVGQSLGAVLFGSAAAIAAFLVVRHLERRAHRLLSSRGEILAGAE